MRFCRQSYAGRAVGTFKGGEGHKLGSVVDHLGVRLVQHELPLGLLPGNWLVLCRHLVFAFVAENARPQQLLCLTIRSKGGRGKVSRMRAHVQLCTTHASSYWESRRRGLRAPWHGSRIGGCRCMCRRWELRRPSRRCRQSQRRPQQLQTCRSDRRPRSGMQSLALGPACLQQRVPACIHERHQFRVSTVQ